MIHFDALNPSDCQNFEFKKIQDGVRPTSWKLSNFHLRSGLRGLGDGPVMLWSAQTWFWGDVQTLREKDYCPWLCSIDKDSPAIYSQSDGNDVEVGTSLVVDAGFRKPTQCSHGPRWLAAAAAVPSWTFPRWIRQRHRQRSSHTFLSRYVDFY